MGGKEEESLEAKVPTPGCGYLAIKALAAPKLFSWRGVSGFMLFVAIWISD